MIEAIIMIILWLLSYFLSKKQGASNGKAALIATGVTAAGYYTGVTGQLAAGVSKLAGSASDVATNGTDPGATNTISTGAGGWQTLGSIGSTALTTAGGVAQSWGPAGTIGAIAAVSAWDDIKKYLPLGLLAFGVYMLVK